MNSYTQCPFEKMLNKIKTVSGLVIRTAQQIHTKPMHPSEDSSESLGKIFILSRILIF